MPYLNFDLRVGSPTADGYEVWVQSTEGETTGTFVMPAELALPMPTPGTDGAPARSARDVVISEPGVITPLLADPGKLLSTALFSGPVRELFVRSRAKAKRDGLGLRVRLRLNARVAGLPWEYLHDPGSNDYLSLSRDTPLVRYQESERPPETLTVTPPLSILGLISAPSDLDPLDVTGEKKRIEEVTALLRGAGLLKLTWLEGSSAADLQKAMRRGPFHILHFVGHGGFDSRTHEGCIVLTNGRGESAELNATSLARLLSDHPSLRVVVLNSCLGAKSTALPSTASVLVARGIPAVIAMQNKITDDAAKVFAKELYESLADELPIDAAVGEARKAISLLPGAGGEWVTPVLFMRSPDGMLFGISGSKTSDVKKMPDQEAIALKAPPPETISAVLVPWLRWSLKAAFAVGIILILNYLVMLGTDYRLLGSDRPAGSSYRPPGFFLLPFVNLVIDAARALMTGVLAHVVIAGLSLLALAIGLYFLWPVSEDPSKLPRGPKVVRGIRTWTRMARRPVLAAVVAFATIGTFARVSSARSLHGELEGRKFADVATGTRPSTLAQAQLCLSLLDDPEVRERSHLDCNYGTNDVQKGRAETVLNDWLAAAALFALIAIGGVGLLRVSRREVGLRPPTRAWQMADSAAQIGGVVAVAAMAWGYGVVNRPLDLRHVRVTAADITCEGYVLNTAASSGFLYNPSTGKVELADLTNSETSTEAAGNIGNVLHEVLVYLTTPDKTPGEHGKCPAPRQ